MREKPRPVPDPQARTRTRRWRDCAAWSVLVLAAAAAAQAIAAQAQPPEAPGSEELTISADAILAPWTGDLDGMIDRRVVRLLTVYSKTYYFIDHAVARGMVQDFGRLLEDYLNKKLKAEGKLERKNVKLRVIIIPVSRDELLPALVAGKGDIAAATLTITDARQQDVDFAAPMYPNVSELVVSGPAADPVSSDRVPDWAPLRNFSMRAAIASCVAISGTVPDRGGTVCGATATGSALVSTFASAGAAGPGGGAESQ